MEISMEIKRELIDKIPDEYCVNIEDDWLLEEDTCTVTFYSLDICYAVLQELFPLASYVIKIDNTIESGFVEEFDDHNYELEENRKKFI